MRLYRKKSPDGVAQGVGPEFKPQYCKRKKKRMDTQNVKYYSALTRKKISSQATTT
jgi:hypothetical protein